MYLTNSITRSYRAILQLLRCQTHIRVCDDPIPTQLGLGFCQSINHKLVAARPHTHEKGCFLIQTHLKFINIHIECYKQCWTDSLLEVSHISIQLEVQRKILSGKGGLCVTVLVSIIIECYVLQSRTVNVYSIHLLNDLKKVPHVWLPWV